VLCCAKAVWLILVTDKKSPDSNTAPSNIPEPYIEVIALALRFSSLLMPLPNPITGSINDIVNDIALNNLHYLLANKNWTKCRCCNLACWHA
jgi:hypothetical protein